VNDTVQLAEGYPQKTIYDSLYEAGYTWMDYFHDFPSALFLARLREPQYWDCFSDMAGFYDDVAAGTLPNYSFVEPRWFNFYDWGASDEHPPHDVKLGEYLIADMYEALRAGPKWESTLFIITYDEHGGFYDHVPPPQDGIPAPDDHRPPSNQPPFNFERLGIRVPCIAISPWINKKTVIHEPSTNNHYTHTSVLSTLKNVFNLPEFLTKRDAWSPAFDNIVQARSTPRTDAPRKLVRPGSSRAQEKWSAYSRKRVTQEQIERAIKECRPCKEPVSDLQKEIIAIARGLNMEWTLESALDHAQAECIDSEHIGSIFVQRQVLKFLKAQKEKHEEAKNPAKNSEWAVI